MKKEDKTLIKQLKQLHTNVNNVDAHLYRAELTSQESVKRALNEVKQKKLLQSKLELYISQQHRQRKDQMQRVQEKDLKVTTSGKMAFKKKIVNTKYINFFKLNLFTHIIFTYNSNLYHRQACFAKEAMDADVTSERVPPFFQPAAVPSLESSPRRTTF